MQCLILFNICPRYLLRLNVFIASLGLLLIFSITGQLRWTALRQNLVIYLIIGIIGIAGFNIGCFYGLQTTSAVNGALIMATTPLMTLLMTILFRW